MIAVKRFVKGVPKSPSSVIALFIPPLIKKITIFMMVMMMIKMINPVFLLDCVKYASFQMQVMAKAVIPAINPQKFHKAGVIKSVPNEMSMYIVKICQKHKTVKPIVLAFPRAAICLSSYSNCFLLFLSNFTLTMRMIKQTMKTKNKPAINPIAKKGDFSIIINSIIKKFKKDYACVSFIVSNIILTRYNVKLNRQLVINICKKIELSNINSEFWTEF